MRRKLARRIAASAAAVMVAAVQSVPASAGTSNHSGRPTETRIGTGNGVHVGKVNITTRLRNGRYELTDPTRGGLSTVDFGNRDNREESSGKQFTDGDNAWGNGTVSSRQSAAVDAYFAAGKTWDYFKNTFGRKGMRGNGQGPSVIVHYGKGRAEAEYDYGLWFGDGKDNKRPLTELDIVAHEFTHGVVESTVGFADTGDEFRGLNDATCDIFGTMVEFNAALAADTPDYLIGEKVDSHGDGKPMRYMDKPSKDGKSPDYWKPGIGRLGDPHHAAGVANHFFYLLAEGSGRKVINGVVYDSPTYDGSKVTGIGREKAAKIWYKALTTQFTSTTDYRNARAGTLKAAAALYGKTGAEYRTVQKAWTAVNVE
ncbi:M4 family metallopeptidase [Streptomyces decoyicus]|uniref:M4 family metallopeptidase n=1 Tax=Streptomyces decoyicus TaxID=249567 RepID=A0ABZ1FRX6_9ACTN|nr:M4 family metallopeptidase [Streptomyces decoyicus]WSB73216.1 M4 family metallopeptidase [Streptomyces decoyicus]